MCCHDADPDWHSHMQYVNIPMHVRCPAIQMADAHEACNDYDCGSFISSPAGDRSGPRSLSHQELPEVLVLSGGSLQHCRHF